MKFKPGHKKIGGRSKGTGNKVDTNIRETYQSLIENNLPDIQKWIDATAKKDPAKAFELILKLSEFCVPKLKAIEHSTNGNNDLFNPIIINLGSGKNPNENEN